MWLLSLSGGSGWGSAPAFLTTISDLSLKENAAGTNLTFRIWEGGVASSSLTVTTTSGNTTLVPDANLKLSGTTSNRTLRVTPATNQFGTAQIQMVVSDPQGGSDTASFTLTVLPVNHAPTLTLSSNKVTVLEDAGLVTLNQLVTSQSSGPPSEASQNLSLTLYYTNRFFSQAPAIDSGGTLTFQVADNAFGTTQIRLVLQDDGGTANGGKDASTNLLTLIVLPVNDPPVFTLSSNLVVARENAGTVTVPGFLTGLSAGPANESGQGWSFRVLCPTNDPTNVTFSTYPTLATSRKTNATLTFRPAVNSFGTNPVTVIMTDTGGTANGGINSFTNQFLLGVYWVDQPPKILGATNRTMLENGSQSRTISVVDVDTAGANLALTASTTNTSLVDVSVTGPDVTGATNASYTLRLVGKTNCNGSATIVVVADDGILKVTNRFVLTVTPVNQPPAFNLSTNLVLARENGGTVNVTNFLTGLKAGPKNESSQSWIFKLVCPTNDPTNVSFGAYPTLKSVGTNATLSFRPATNSYGTNTVTVLMTDSGGTNNGGVNSFTNSFVLGVSFVNQAPYMVGATNRSIRENETQHTTAAITVYDVDGPGGGLSLTATATNSLAGVTVSGPTQVGASNATFTLTFAPQTNQFGSATVKLVASDGSASRTNTFTLTVIPVNQPPTFTLSSNVVVAAENAGSVYVTNFLTGLSAGPPNEASQTFAFSLKTVTNQSTNLTFITAPAIKTVGANGMLFFKTTTNSFGTNDVTIIMLDSGTTNNGGIRGYTNAFQLQVPWSNQPPFIAWATNRSLNENQTTNLTVTLDVFDTDSPVTNLSLTASSTNTALVDASITGTRVSNGTNLLCDLTFAPKTNAFGSTYITLVASDGLASRTNTFKLTVNFIDQPPTFILTTNLLLIPEGAGLLKLTNLIIGVSPGPTNEKNQTLTFTVCTGTNQATNVLFQTYPTVKTNSAFDAYTNGLLTFQTATNSYGTNLVWVVLTDSGVATNGGCNTYSNWFTLGVVRTNQAPYFIGATNRTWFEDSTSNATAVVSLFDIDSPGSSLSLSASSSDTSIMNVSVTGTNAVGGTNADFVLGFTLVPNTSGKVVITLVGTDGQAYRTNSFVITVNRVNHPPSFDLSTNLVRFARNCGPISLTNFVTNCVAGPPNESDQRWSFTVVTSTNDATNVTFQAYPTLGTNNTFAFQTQTNAWGTNTVTILMQDNGGAANGGIDTYSNSFQMEIYWVEIPPAILGATNYSLFENSSTNLTMTLTVSSVSVDASNVTLSASSSDLTLADVAVSPPYSLTSTTAVFTLTFIPQAGAAGSNTITLVANDGVASSTNTLMLTILPVNQAPYFDLLTGELTLYENSGFVSINYFADNMSVGPDNESGQTWTFVVTNIAPGASNVLFSTAPNIATNGTFTFRTRTNSFGTNLFAVIMRDSGGTANGAVDSYTNYFSFEIGFSNQPPWIAGAGAQTLLENAATNLSLLLYDFDSPGNTLSLAASTTNTGLVSVSVTGPNSVGATNATFMLNLATVANANGRANIMLVASDGQNSRTNNLSLNIIAVNQTPSFRFATNELAADEDAGAVSLANFVTNISVGPPNESGQTWTFTVECATDDPTNVTFLAFPAVATNGTLTFCTDIESFGTNTVTVIMQDSGGVGYGAINTFTNSFVLEVADASALPAVAFARAPAEVAASVPPFAARQGAYAGLFFETNCLANDSSGYFALVLDATGAFSGYVLSAGQSNQFAGQFGASDALAVVAIPGVGLMNLSLDAGADSADGISGSVVAATGWNATLLGLLKTGGTPAPQAGAYQLILPGRSDPACGPADASRLNLSVSPDGQVLLSGSLADNTGVNQQGQISRDGQFPLYVSCGAAGSLSGWLGWDANADHPWQGSLLWIRSGADAELGFTNQVQVISSRIEAPANGSVRSRKS